MITSDQSDVPSEYQKSIRSKLCMLDYYIHILFVFLNNYLNKIKNNYQSIVVLQPLFKYIIYFV